MIIIWGILFYGMIQGIKVPWYIEVDEENHGQFNLVHKPANSLLHVYVIFRLAKVTSSTDLIKVICSLSLIYEFGLLKVQQVVWKNYNVMDSFLYFVICLQFTIPKSFASDANPEKRLLVGDTSNLQQIVQNLQNRVRQLETNRPVQSKE